MALTDTHVKYCPLTPDAASGGSALSNFPALITAAALPSDIFDSTNGAQTDGGDIRFSSDSAGTTELAFEIVEWDKAGNSAQIWVKIPSLSASSPSDIYIWWKPQTGTLTGYSPGGTYGRSAVWSGEVGVYHLDEASGDAVNAATGGEAARGGTRTYSQAGQIGDAVDFSSGGWFTAANSSAYNVGGAMHLSAWFETSSQQSGKAMVALEPSQTDYRALLYLTNNSATVAVYLRVGGTVYSATYVKSSGNYADSAWHKLELDFDKTRSSERIQLWIDGVKQATATAANADVSTTTSTFSIGRWYSGNNYTGLLDEVRLGASSLSAGWIETAYTMESAPGSWWVVGSVGTIGGGGASATPASASAAGAVGLLGLTASSSITLAGVSATGSVGLLNVSTGANASITLSGVSASGSVGSVNITVSSAKTLAGVAASGAAGVLSTSVLAGTVAQITGVSASGFVGSVALTASSLLSLPGVSATAAAGSVTISVPVDAIASIISTAIGERWVSVAVAGNWSSTVTRH